MKITVEVKDVYGNKTIYPVCEISKAFAALARTKTLTWDAIKIIKGMGYEIEQKTKPLNL